MIHRRNFLKLGSLLVPAAFVEPRRVYSFLWAKPAKLAGRVFFFEEATITLGGRAFPAFAWPPQKVAR